MSNPSRFHDIISAMTAGAWQTFGVRGKLRATYSDYVMETHDIGPDDNKGCVLSVYYDPKKHRETYSNAQGVALAIRLARDLDSEEIVEVLARVIESHGRESLSREFVIDDEVSLARAIVSLLQSRAVEG